MINTKNIKVTAVTVATMTTLDAETKKPGKRSMSLFATIYGCSIPGDSSLISLTNGGEFIVVDTFDN